MDKITQRRKTCVTVTQKGRKSQGCCKADRRGVKLKGLLSY